MVTANTGKASAFFAAVFTSKISQLPVLEAGPGRSRRISSRRRSTEGSRGSLRKVDPYKLMGPNHLPKCVLGELVSLVG